MYNINLFSLKKKYVQAEHIILTSCVSKILINIIKINYEKCIHRVKLEDI